MELIVNRFFAYLNKDVDSKRFKTWKYYLPKAAIKNYNVIFNWKTLYYQVIDSDIKR